MKNFKTSHTQKTLKKALKHQRIFGILKIILIGCGVGGLFLIFMAPSFFNQSVIQQRAESDISQSSETEKQILNPHFEGTDDENQPYTVRAKLANQVSEDQVDLTNPEGEIGLKDGEKMKIQADQGTLTNQNKELDLEGDVQFNYVDCVVLTPQAHANFENKTVQGGKVRSLCPEGVIEAGSFSVDQKQGIVTYTNRPHLILKGRNS